MSTLLLAVAETEALAAIDAVMHSDPELGRQRCVRLIEESRLMRSPLAHVLAAERYGLIMDHQGHAADARNILFEALQVAQAQHLFANEACLLEQIARGYYTGAEYRQAIQYWARAVEICETTGGNDRIWMLAKVGLGQVYDALGDHASAVVLHRTALGRIGLAYDPWLDAKIKINLGVNLSRMGEDTEAQQVFEAALALCNDGHFWDYAAESHLRLGELALRAGQLDQAEVHLFGGLATARMVDYRWGEANILLVIAEVHARRGEFDRALATLMEGVQISSTYQFTHILERQHLAIAEYAERMGGYPTALAALKEGFALAGRIQAAAAPGQQRELEDKAGLRPSPGRLLVELSNHPAIDAGRLDEAFAEICRQACLIMGVERAQVFLLDDAQQRLQSACLFVAAAGGLQPGPAWTTAEWPQLSEWLAEADSIIAHDCAHHPLTWGLTGAYLQPLAISSLLAFPLRVSGRVAGLFWLEHSGEQRNWTPDELVYASQLADMSARALASNERKQFQHEIHQLNVRLMEVNEALEARVQERTRALEFANEELRHAMHKLVQSEKLASLGSLVAGIAHELNTPLGGSLTVATTLMDEARAFEDAMHEGRMKRAEAERFVALCRDGTTIMQRNIERAAGLIARFRQVAVDTASEQRQHFALRQVVGDVLATFTGALQRAGHTLDCHIAGELEFDSYPGALEQALMQMLSNSLQHGLAGRQGGVIRVRARPLDGSYAELVYEDNGCGIPAQLQKRVFDPFFTTRMGQGGSGLGLYLVYNLLTGPLGGELRLESEPDQFTRFVMTLPLQAP
ncbi:ATP-binding protein [Chitinilyticum aquatile]|uniref:ATP-binding protein n=1 Tax=Chitinilyticum aquatile TaxID=362520 RepID=UPI00048CF294|nr:ATP-binding protein [Chitinilyticum aquatile]